MKIFKKVNYLILYTFFLLPILSYADTIYYVEENHPNSIFYCTLNNDGTISSNCSSYSNIPISYESPIHYDKSSNTLYFIGYNYINGEHYSNLMLALLNNSSYEIISQLGNSTISTGQFLYNSATGYLYLTSEYNQLYTSKVYISSSAYSFTNEPQNNLSISFSNDNKIAYILNSPSYYNQANYVENYINNNGYLWAATGYMLNLTNQSNLNYLSITYKNYYYVFSGNLIFDGTQKPITITSCEISSDDYIGDYACSNQNIQIGTNNDSPYLWRVIAVGVHNNYMYITASQSNPSDNNFYIYKCDINSLDGSLSNCNKASNIEIASGFDFSSS